MSTRLNTAPTPSSLRRARTSSSVVFPCILGQVRNRSASLPESPRCPRRDPAVQPHLEFDRLPQLFQKPRIDLCHLVNSLRRVSGSKRESEITKSNFFYVLQAHRPRPVFAPGLCEARPSVVDGNPLSTLLTKIQHSVADPVHVLGRRRRKRVQRLGRAPFPSAAEQTAADIADVNLASAAAKHLGVKDEKRRHVVRQRQARARPMPTQCCRARLTRRIKSLTTYTHHQQLHQSPPASCSGQHHPKSNSQ